MQASEISSAIRVKPWGKDQGEFVEINACDFDPAVHSRFGTSGGDAPAAARPDPLDHDGDGHRGGSEKGAASTAAKGAKKRKAKGK